MADTMAPSLGDIGDLPGGSRHSALGRLWYRNLDEYPSTGKRMFFLGVVVLAAILLYYELYVGGAVAPSIIRTYHMSFVFYVNITVVANAVGAFSSLLAGIGDRWGRANMVAYGLFFTGAIVAFGIPNAPNEWIFGILVGAVGFVEGIILVATPALVRDFSPQLGRASAMGFWTLGPVLGSLCVSEVSSHTLSHLHAWQDQFVICGIAGLVLFVIALFGLRELSPRIRDQLMVSLRDRALIEAKAKGIDIEEGLRHPWRQMLHLDVIGSAFGVSVMLLIYYTLVAFFVVYFATIFGFTEARANALGNWYWIVDAVVLVLVGLASDRLRVRKPFMLVGAVIAAVGTVIFLTRTTHPTTGYYTFVWMISIIAIGLALAFATWMAIFTETVEKRNPALTATGLAVWGWVLRAVVAISIFVLPYVVSTMTPLVTYGPAVEAAVAKVDKAPAVTVPYSSTKQPLLAVVGSHQALFTQLAKYPSAKDIPSAVLDKAIAAVGVPALEEASKYAAPLRVLSAHGNSVSKASKSSPNQWRHWWWVCFAGIIAFIPLIFLTAGRWRPKRAREDYEEHERLVAEEMRQLGIHPEAS